MDIPIAEMPECNPCHTGMLLLDSRDGGFNETWHAFDRYRDVVLHRRANGAFGRRNRVAQLPELFSLRLVRRQNGVEDQFVFHCLCELDLDSFAQF